MRESVKELSDQTLESYMSFLKPIDLIDLTQHYIKLEQVNRADAFIGRCAHDKRLHEQDVSFLQNQLADALYTKGMLQDAEEKWKVTGNSQGLSTLADTYYAKGRLADAERLWKLTGNRKKLLLLPAAYREAGDTQNATRSFAEYSQ